MHITILLIFSVLATVLAHEDDVHTIKYNADNFSEEIWKKNHFVMFYAPWCGHCQRLAPTWEQLAEMLNEDDSNIRIAKVDCTIEGKVCSDQDITGYPTLKFFKLGDTEGVKFRGTRDLPSLTTFINEQLREGDEDTNDVNIPQPESNLVEFTSDNFDSIVGTGKHFVKFYAPWCGHCQKLAPTWEQLAKSLELETNVRIGKVDCTQYRSICSDFDVKGYPTLLWIEDGRKVDKYQGDRSHEALKQYVNNMLGSTKEPDTDSAPASDDTVPVGELTGDNFAEGVQSGLTFVKFYAPWCGHCKRLSPTWDSLRQKLLAKSGVQVVKVDCTLEASKKLCNDEEVDGFPTIFLYKDGKKIAEYVGNRSLDDLYDFVVKHLGHDEL